VNELRLYHDMGLSGDDAGEFLDAVHARFSTRFEGSEFETYSPNEGEGLPRFFRKLGFDDHKKPFTFSHLVKIVEAGQWSEPDTEAGPRP